MHCQGQHKWLAQLVGLVVRQQLVKLFFLSRSGEQATAGQQDKMQLLREEKLAANLKALLRRWVEGDQTGFRVGPTACAVLGCAVLCCAVLCWAGLGRTVVLPCCSGLYRFTQERPARQSTSCTALHTSCTSCNLDMQALH